MITLLDIVQCAAEMRSETFTPSDWAQREGIELNAMINFSERMVDQFKLKMGRTPSSEAMLLLGFCTGVEIGKLLASQINK